MTTLDALVVGGGPAGSTAALVLARAGWRVGIVEKCAFPRRKVCGEFISATTWPLLRAMDNAASTAALEYCVRFPPGPRRELSTIDAT